MRSKPSHPIRPDALAKDVLRLSRLLTRDREDLPADYLRDPGLRSAYLHYYLPSNLAKIQLPLRELMRHPAGILEKKRLRVLDLGTGPGTSVMGMLEFFGAGSLHPVLEFIAVDQVEENLRLADELFRERSPLYPGTAGLRTIQRPISGKMDAGEGPFDLVVFSNVLNELFPGDAERIARRAETVGTVLDALLAADGACIIVEPALRDTTRDMLLVRDRLIARGMTVYSPCLMQENCPALANPKDWCHEDIPWSPPELVREIDKLTGLRKDSLKFSYVVLRKDKRTLADCCGSDAFRVVSEQLRSKGKSELYLCGKGGRKIAMRQDKDRLVSNKAFDGLRRGSVARFERMEYGEKRNRVTKDTKVTVIFPAGGSAGSRESS